MTSPTMLSVVVIAAIALILGAIVLWRRGGAPLKAVLMFVLALVMIANVALWVGPGEGGPVAVAGTGDVGRSGRP